MARLAACWLACLLSLGACGGGGGGGVDQGGTTAPGSGAPASPSPLEGPAAGNPAGSCAVPAAAAAVDTRQPDHVVGQGTPASCTAQAFVAAVAQGGIITFDCGAEPVTIALDRTAKVFNDRPDVTIDGGGRVTLSGGGRVRILYQNTCDPRQVWTSSQCDVQDRPHLTVQNITFVDGEASGQDEGRGDVYGGGAIYVRGGRLKVVNSRFFNNRCDSTGPDVGGAAVRAFGTSPQAPVYVVGSTFGGAAGYGNACSNGAGLSGLSASFAVFNSVFSHNEAIGQGANPARPGTPGGGSGGAIYQDGNAIGLAMCGSLVEHNTAAEGGGALFFVSNNRTGTVSLTDSVLRGNPSGGFETSGLPGIFMLAAPGQPVLSGTTLAP